MNMGNGKGQVNTTSRCCETSYKQGLVGILFTCL